MKERLEGQKPRDYRVFEIDSTSASPVSDNEAKVNTFSSTTRSSTGSRMLYNDQNGSIPDSPTWSQLVPNLETGVEYFIRVSAQGGGVGYGNFAEARSNPIVPKGLPRLLGEVSISRVDAATLTVEIEETVAENGAAVEAYLIEWGTTPLLSDAERTTLRPDYHIQSVRLNAWRRGWTPDSAFALSLFDFGGSFTSRLGGNDGNKISTFVSIVEGSNTLMRVTPNATAGFGDASLYKAVPRGGFVRVGGQVFRVCLDSELPYEADSLTLCSTADPYEPHSFVGVATQSDNSLTRVPAYVMDTAIGSAFRLASGDTFLRTFDGPDTNLSVNDLTSVLARGDHLRLGHPENGRVFTVCRSDATSVDFNSTSLPLCSAENSGKVTSVLKGDILSATREVQSFGLWTNTSAVISNVSVETLGFRLTFGDEVSSTSEAGGDPGCILFSSSAAEVPELEEGPAFNLLAIKSDSAVSPMHAGCARSVTEL